MINLKAVYTIFLESNKYLNFFLVIGGLLIGLISEFAAVYGISSWTVTIVYGIFVIILLFKPAGLLGKDIREKV